MMKPQNVKKCAMPGTAPLQQLALPEDLDDLGPQPLAGSCRCGPAPAARSGSA